MSGQSVFLNVVATKPMRYIAVDRHALRRLMVEDAPLADLLLTAFNPCREHLQQRADVGIEIAGPLIVGRHPAPDRVRAAAAAAVSVERRG